MSDVLKILVADPISDTGVQVLRASEGIDVEVRTGLDPEALLEIIADFDGLIVRSETKVTPALLARAARLKVVGRAGVGVDNIDLDAATSRGVVVMNTPSGNTISTAEHAFTLMLSLARRIPQAHASVIGGKWERKRFQGVEIHGKRLAILGMGRIGTEFAKRALAFGMQVVAYDPFLTAARAQSLKVALAGSADEALDGADIVTLHLPSTPETHHLLNESRLRKMKRGAWVINCARGGLVDESAARRLLDEGQLSGIALDVFENEPPPAGSPWFECDHCVFTPHLGASTTEAQENVGIEIAAQLRDFLINGTIRHAVNMPSLDRHAMQVVQPYLDLARSLGRLVSIIGPVQCDSIRVAYSGSLAAIDTALPTRAVLTGFLGAASHEPPANLVNAPALARSLGIDFGESSAGLATPWADRIEVTTTKDGRTCTVAGTLIGATPRIAHIAGHHVESGIHGHFLFVENDDRPGIVGLIGTRLGEAGINIATMALSRDPANHRAINVIEIDTVPPQSLVDGLRGSAGILRVITFDL
jgi:D-3-phosphoglycerate dehydrogenase